jgi:hypothetical protein
MLTSAMFRRLILAVAAVALPAFLACASTPEPATTAAERPAR